MRKKLIPAPTGPTEVQTLHGFPLQVRAHDDGGVDRMIYYSGTYEYGTLRALEILLRPGDTFADVGANLGLMTVFGARAVGPQGKVHAFEAHPGTRSALVHNLSINGLANVVVHDCALGESSAEGTLFEQPECNRGSATLLPSSLCGSSHQVKVRSLADALPPQENVHLMKLDIEGMELPTLRGGTRLLSGASPPILIVEYAPDHWSSAREVPRWLCDNFGYRVFRHLRHKAIFSPLVETNPEAPSPSGENLYYFQSHHIARTAPELFA